MLLKKQTVWLLTMLSLVVVLSVYYVLQEPAPNDLATSGKEDAESASNQMSDKDLEILTQAAGDEVYEAIRMDLQDKRGEEKMSLQNQLGEKELTADEKNKLYDEMEKIDELTTKEQIIETSIKGLGYSDALVEIENQTVNILVKAEEHSKADAVNILKVVKDEISTNYVPNIEFDTK
ncbi:SpoIIIAH-like family protein [Lederbergia galactosidilytica]|uniref:Stage III sporulation protein AH n=2 Tax=Lederbergia galactosidilytica TaxID=217031 RepID=A0A178A659_9BACI|nr:SpoIIIAH-like family protein [Lederbergia galactosidilytica]KRG15648.1 stage III sporulation protein AH [Virgibacillus soli]MBP1914742.1 stage III sporulation protein AH [Lederbergia galactosidilytica]OAK75319.1 stage III sporulation protein AH [Lederbergia galactosidilytica]